MGVVAKSESKKELILKTGDFWVDIKIKDFRTKGRVPTVVDDEAALYLLERAFILFLDDVGTYEQAMIKKGVNHLKDVISPKVGDRTRQEILFESALFAGAKKLICDDYKDIDLGRRAGEDKLKEILDSAAAWHADYLRSIRSFLGEPRNYVGIV